MTKSNAVEIAGIDVSAKRMTTLIEETYQNNIDKVTINFRFDVNDLVTLSKFQSVIIWETTSGTLKINANRKFIGEIAKIERTSGVITIIAFSELWQAVQTEVNQVFDKNVGSEAGEGSEIFITLAGLAGLTADSTSVVATGTGASDIVIDQFVCAKTDVFERMQALADIYNYQFNENFAVQKIRFEPLGFVTNVNTIFIGGSSNNVQSFTKWKDDNTSFFNKVEVIGAFQEQRITETFNGDASTTQFTLTNEPEIVEVTVDSVIQTGGVIGSTAVFDYSVDKKNKQINFESGSIPGVGVNNIVVDYSYRTPRPVVRTNDSSVTEIGRVIKKRFTFTDIETVDDAEKRALNLLAIFSESFRSTKVKINPSVAETFAITIGQAIRVVDSRQGFDEMMIIKKMRTTFPKNDIEIELGDREFRVASYEYDTTLRIKRLEEEAAKAGTFVTEIVDPTHSTQVRIRDVQQSQRTIISGVLYWDSTIQGNWDEENWGLSTEDAFIDDYVRQHLNIYDEDFGDTRYKDTGNTTATWGGTGSVVFTSGQIATSTSIDLDNGTVAAATLTAKATMVAHYLMNDNLANKVVLDGIGNNDGTLNGGDNTKDKSVTGKIVRAFSLNGTDDFVNIDGVLTNILDTTTKGTWTAWIKPVDATPASIDILISFNDTNANEFIHIRIKTAGEFLAKATKAGVAQWTLETDAVPFSDNTYTHVAITHDGTAPVLYINGVAVAQTFTGSLDKTAWFSALTGLDNGRIADRSVNSGGETNHFNGEIDDVRIYDRDLTSAEILSIYNLGNGTEGEVGLIAGNFTYEMSANGGTNYETVTSGIRHFFTNTGTDLRFRITENATSTAVVNNISIKDYH